MPEVFKERIVKLLRHPHYTPVGLAELARTLGVSSENYPHFKQAFDELRLAGRVIIGGRNLVSLPPLSGQIIGTFRANPKGFGFVTPLEASSHGDLFIPPDETADAMTGDRVLVKVVKKGKRGGQMQFAGRVVEILERAKNRFVGTLTRHNDAWLVQPDGNTFVESISVDDVTAKNAKEKDKVVVEILTYPTDKHLARGVIIDVLGKAGRYETEIRSIIYQYHLPGEFDQECMEQSRAAAAEFDHARTGEREDLTGKVIVTIDPPDAKDFDDAISLEKDSNGNWVLGVHIADVSSFVTEGSPLDLEAKTRGNSIYLPGRTIPMLPEILSNGICSLQPQQQRFTKSAFLTYDEDGHILSRRFADSIICSTQRLTYLQADAALRGRTKGIKPEVVELLGNMESLSRTIEARRVKSGMLHLELPETELIFDKAGLVVDARPADNCYPHTIIEMFMVEANDAVASLLDKLKINFLRRIHPAPNELSMKNLSVLVRALGLSIPRNPDRFALQDLLASVKGADCELAVNMVVLRSLEKAQYAPSNVGHFALASTHYCHFTSPIRRYADLTIHRALENYLQHRTGPAYQQYNLVEIGRHITLTEQIAEDAENELNTVLVLRMLSKHLGDKLDCVVTGLAAFGVFARCKKYGVDGLVRMEDLGQDTWKFNQKTHSITGLRSGFAIRLGQAMKVRIVAVNVAARQLNLTPAEPLVKPVVRAEKKRKSLGSRKKGRKKRKS
jgi:ribonuclease R